MTQTTTNRGRGLLPTPDLLYDTLDGGTALFGVVNTLWTWFSDHMQTRYYSLTLANNATQTVTHNFGLALSALKVQVWEAGARRTDAQVAADYTQVNVSGTAFTFQNTSGGSKTLLLVVWGGKLGINSGDFDAAASMTTTGDLTAANVKVSGDNGLVLNSGNAGSGADWKATLKRALSGMTADAVLTLPAATSSLSTLGLAETLDLKTLTGCAGITMASAAPINWAAGNVALGASIGANTMTIAGASSTVRAPGALSCGTLLTDADDLVLNNDAAASSADWKATLRRPAAGMTAAAVYTLPIATTTLLSTNLAQVVTLKDIDGGTASNTNRITVPKDTKANLDALTRKVGTLVYATDLLTLFVDNGTALISGGGGGGGGGGGAAWNGVSGNAATLDEDNGERVWRFAAGAGQQVALWFKVPTSYVTGSQIKFRLGHYSADVTGTNLLSTTAYLVRKATVTAASSTTNSRVSTNTALNLASSAVANGYYEIVCDLTDSSGQINSVAVTAGDLIRVILTRGTDTATSDIFFVPSSTEQTLS